MPKVVKGECGCPHPWVSTYTELLGLVLNPAAVSRILKRFYCNREGYVNTPYETYSSHLAAS